MKQSDFGKKVTEIRKANGLTQEDLAKKCKITIRTIQRIESGLVLPRAFTIKLLSDNLGFDFLEISNDVKPVNLKLKRTDVLLEYTKDLFNLKINTMKKVSILFVMLCGICIGLFFHITDGKAQTTLKPDKKHFYEEWSRGIIYFWPRGTEKTTSNKKDTADFRIIGGDLIQEYRNKIFQNGKYIGRALKGDTVIYDAKKTTIRPSYWDYESSYGQKIHYLIPTSTRIDNVVVHIDTEFLYIGKHQIKEYDYKIFLDGVFHGQVNPGASVRFRDEKVEIID